MASTWSGFRGAGFQFSLFHHGTASTGSCQRKAATELPSSSAGLPSSLPEACVSLILPILVTDAQGEGPAHCLVQLPCLDLSLLVDHSSKQRLLPSVCVFRLMVTEAVCAFQDCMHSHPVLQLPSLLRSEGTTCSRLSHAERLSHQTATHAAIEGQPGGVLMTGEGEVMCVWNPSCTAARVRVV